MFNWPLPNSLERKIPVAGEPGSFWENRQNKFNCGINIYTPDGSEAQAIEKSKAVFVGDFTSSESKPFYNDTKYVIVKTINNIFVKFAGLKNATINVGDVLLPGQKIGEVGALIKEEYQNDFMLLTDPEYIPFESNSFLHIELLKPPVMEVKPYIAGYFLENYKPVSLINPELYFISIFPELKKAA